MRVAGRDPQLRIRWSRYNIRMVISRASRVWRGQISNSYLSSYIGSIASPIAKCGGSRSN